MPRDRRRMNAFTAAREIPIGYIDAMSNWVIICLSVWPRETDGAALKRMWGLWIRAAEDAAWAAVRVIALR
jgi:hypothetical protein